MPFGQLVVGPAGSGKTTYCNGMQQYLTLLGRKTVIVNLDPANNRLPYECAVDISELVSLQEVQENLNLGPNGGNGVIGVVLGTALFWQWPKQRSSQKSIFGSKMLHRVLVMQVWSIVWTIWTAT